MPRCSAAMLWLVSMIAICDHAHADEPKPQAVPAARVRELLAAMDVVVAPDGAISSVVPDAALPEPIRQLLVKRVSQWRYEAPMWLGKPAQLSTRLILVLQPVPTTSGGYALQVLRLGGEWDADSEFAPRPPHYPLTAKMKGIGGVFVYTIRVEADGSPANIQRRYPQDVKNKIIRALDDSAQASIQDWRWPPFLVNGAPVACDVIMPITYIPSGAPPPTSIDWKHDEVLMTQKCPQPALATRIENLIL